MANIAFSIIEMEWKMPKCMLVICGCIKCIQMCIEVLYKLAEHISAGQNEIIQLWNDKQLELASKSCNAQILFWIFHKCTCKAGIFIEENQPEFVAWFLSLATVSEAICSLSSSASKWRSEKVFERLFITRKFAHEAKKIKSTVFFLSWSQTTLTSVKCQLQ